MKVVCRSAQLSRVYLARIGIAGSRSATDEAHQNVRVRNKDGKFPNLAGRYSASVANPDRPEDLLRLLNTPSKRAYRDEGQDVDGPDENETGSRSRGYKDHSQLTEDGSFLQGHERLGVHGDLLPAKLRKAMDRILKCKYLSETLAD